MKRIEEIDPNFKPERISADDVQYYNCLTEPFEVRGLHQPYQSERFMRLPADFNESTTVNDGVKRLMYHTVGGRVRFVTDSPYIALIADVEYRPTMQHMARTCQFGFDLYAADVKDRKRSQYKYSFFPHGLSADNSVYDSFYDFESAKMREITINFPTYTGVNKVVIGLMRGSVICKAEPYTVDEPIVFYGCSIMQGGCASRPGTVSTALLSNWLDADYRNLGFSGSDKGEPEIAEYIAGLSMSAFVYGYGHNAPSLDHYKNTHYPFYEIVRKAHPDLPIIIMSPPIYAYIKKPSQIDTLMRKRAVVIESYLKAFSSGDKNVYFVDGFTAFGNGEAEVCTVDGTHPNDHGFYNMAKALHPVLEYALKK